MGIQSLIFPCLRLLPQLQQGLRPATSARRARPSPCRLLAAPLHPHRDLFNISSSSQATMSGRGDLAGQTVQRYQEVIDGVVARVKPEFAQEGIDE